jgi:penicillin-binding protein 2
MSRNKRNLKQTIKKRYFILNVIVLVSMTILTSNLLYIQIFKHNYYEEKLKYLATNIVYGETLPRGKIYDTLGRVIVDNEDVNVIEYRKLRGITTKKEIELS